MRDIKFRAWDNLEERMYNNVEGGIYQDPDEIVPFDKILGFASYNVMQYTGLKDKNGTEIYEGDIIRFDGEFSVVRYDEEAARFVLDDYGIFGCLMEYGWDEGAGGFGIVDTNGFDDFNDISEIEIIGNIYENPRLLEGRE